MNEPAVSDGMLVDVNKTGMWYKEILLDCNIKVILNQQETDFFC
jgi:hypothetical protein